MKKAQTGTIIWVIVIAVVLIGLIGGYFLFFSATDFQNSDSSDTDGQLTIVDDNQDSSQTNDNTNGMVTDTNNIKEFSMTAKKWEFSPETIIVNNGDIVKLHITSIDVDHGFNLPDFNVNEELEPGKTVNIEFTADKTGTFTFFCNVFCGSGHSDMEGMLIVN